MTLTEAVAKKIIAKLLKGQDYRIEIVTLINAAFLQYAIEFFKKVIDAKLRNKDLTTDWYKKSFLNPKLSSKEIAINSGLNQKTISNMYNTGKRSVVIEASNKHYDELYQAIEDLIKSGSDIDLTLTVKFNKVSVDLNINESLIVINTLAVKRAELRGGFWSTAGKRVEEPLMLTLCKLYEVPDSYYKTKIAGTNKEIDPNLGFSREVDFFLINPESHEEYKCEVKLMGKGNPESADAVIARDSRVFIADKLSETNKRQLNSRHVEWVELRCENGFKKFLNVLKNLGIPCKDYSGDITPKLEKVFSEIFK